VSSHDYTLFDLALSNDAAGLGAALAAGADPEESHPQSGMTLLAAAQQANAHEAMRVLLAAGADPNRRYTWRSRMSEAIRVDEVALHFADPAAIRLLHDAGAELDAANTQGWTALAYAVSHGELETVECLLSLGASRALGGPVAQKHPTLEALCASELAFLRGLEAVPNPKLAARIATQEQVQVRLAQP
jgi:ankyrin repeat protein